MYLLATHMLSERRLEHHEFSQSYPFECKVSLAEELDFA